MAAHRAMSKPAACSPIGCATYRSPSVPIEQSGFTYLGVLFIVVFMGIALAAAGTMWSAVKQRENEKELLFAGSQFRQAIQRYYERTPGAIKKYPPSLEELVKDSRYVTTQRYLRKIYLDPMTGKAEWGVVEAPGGGVMGVYSRSDAHPTKIANFSEANQAFEGKLSYSDWKFVYISPQMLPANPGNPPLLPDKR